MSEPTTRVRPTLERLNALPAADAEEELLACCGSRAWSRRMAAARPFRSEEEMAEEADRVWRGLSESDWLEAFAAHPRIGEKTGTDWSRQEQAGTAGASPETLANLADANRDYEERFGHVFIVCASGKNAAEMLRLLESRLGNDPRTELAIAAEEQRKITRLRLQKLLGGIV